MSKDAVIHVAVPKATKQELIKLSKVFRVSVSAVIRRAIEAYIVKDRSYE